MSGTLTLTLSLSLSLSLTLTVTLTLTLTLPLTLTLTLGTSHKEAGPCTTVNGRSIQDSCALTQYAS